MCVHICLSISIFILYVQMYIYIKILYVMTFKAVYRRKRATESFQCQDIHLSTDHASCGNAPATPRHLAVAFNYFAQHIQIDPTMSSNVNPNSKKEKNHLAAASVEYDFSH